MIEDIDRHMGHRLRVRRRALDMTQQALAAELNVGFRQVHKYETAINRMSAGTVWTLARILQVDITYFYDGLTREAGRHAGISAVG